MALYKLGKKALDAAVAKLKKTAVGKKMSDKQLRQRAKQDAFDDARTARKERLLGRRRDVLNRKEDAEFAKKTKKQMLEELAEEEYIMGPTNIKLPNPGMKKGGGVKKLLKDINKKTRREETLDRKGMKRLLNKEDKKTRREEKEFQKYLNKTLGMKKGGMVKKCKVDGIAIRGRTKAKHK